MPDVTLAPTLIDTSPQEGAQLTISPIGGHNPFFHGPFVANNALYAVLLTTNGSALVTVFKSTDGGVTWTQKDAVHSPAYTGIGRMTARLNPDGHTITIAYNTTSVSPFTLSWITFSALTDTFTSGAIPNLTVVSTSGSLFEFDFVVRSSATDILIVYSLVVGPNAQQLDLGFSVLSAGAWTAFSSIAAGNDASQIGWQVPALVYDSVSGITNGLTQRVQLIVGVSFASDYAFQISGTNVATVPVQLSPSIANYRPNYGRPQIWQGQIAFPVYNVPLSDSRTFVMRVYVGSSIAAPVFTFTDLDGGSTLSFDCAVGQVVVEGSTLWAIWLYWPNNTALQLRRSVNTGSGWGGVQVFYDAASNPPNGLALASQGMFAVNGAQIASLGVIITVNDATATNPLAYLLRTTSAPPPPVPPGINIVLGLKGMKVYPQPA